MFVEIAPRSIDVVALPLAAFALRALDPPARLGDVHRRETPDEMYFGTGDAVPADLTSRAAAARRARVEANRSAACETCPSVEAAA